MIEKFNVYPTNNSKSISDIFSKIYLEQLNENYLMDMIKEMWEKIWKDISIPLRKKKNKFREEFTKCLLKNLENHPWFLRFKALKIYEVLEDDLKDFAKTLQKIKNNKMYNPEIPSAKEIYKEIILPELKINTLPSYINCLTDSLPEYSCLIEIIFKLKKPYLSKDDDDFYIIDNPIVKDKVFKLPMVRATTWKGALRFAALKVFEDWVYEKLNKSKLDKETVFRERARIVKLFGNEKDSQEEYLGKLCLLAIGGELPAGEKLKEEIEKFNKEFEKWLIDEKIISKDVPSRSGRLFFYPTFFDRISLDVITPLSRETKTPVRGPIYFEIVPENTKGIFRLFYYPFDLVAKGEFDKIKNEVKEDLEFLAKALKKMFYETGFSAKKTSGFGVIHKINDSDIRVDGFKSNEVKGIILNTIHQS